MGFIINSKVPCLYLRGTKLICVKFAIRYTSIGLLSSRFFKQFKIAATDFHITSLTSQSNLNLYLIDVVIPLVNFNLCAYCLVC